MLRRKAEDTERAGRGEATASAAAPARSSIRIRSA